MLGVSELRTGAACGNENPGMVGSAGSLAACRAWSGPPAGEATRGSLPPEAAAAGSAAGDATSA